ncbi:MAG: 50S ribosomal protein L19 [Thaumarchaeota archaeon 13_1_40CM_3_50_5]|nr:MAG: 50S ribosomal protein L19 [Candidatus Nitrososphaera sp. 13_1_40CM_48_12]OLC25305.1 MAG: 50S ribosomal protein L19 [Thaumarchaeota archaeon 13_1_40CM_4_48_7]OLC80821.1 MAG: 50S ribosomal protein L19 [Thaumarchaeota archaeon 13_1_40CM_3_50_5]TLY11685.1 MAG: 50S ribosomal protein L19e [Nitrososphaerota archaeon]
MVVNIAKKRELVARILDVGANRIRFEPDRLEDVADSITRENIRSLVKSGAIWTVQLAGTSRGRAMEKRSVWKVHGKGPGSKKGKKTARVGKKEVYVIRVRSMRYHLKVLKERKDITNETYWQLYKKVNGGQVRSLAHLRELVKEVKSR